MEIFTKSTEETKKLGRKMATDLVISHKSSVIALTGDLGSGKTTFVQGFAEGLGIKHGIISPTFIILRKYKVHSSAKAAPSVSKYRVKNLYHLDLYRFEGNIKEEVRNLGIEEVWEDPRNLVVIEWAEKIGGMLPKDCIRIKFEVLNETERKINIMNYES